MRPGRSRSPTFTLAAVIALALGIGLTTAIFRIVHGVLLRPLPFDEPNRLLVTDEDRAGSVPAVVINEAAAARFFPGAEPIGRRLLQFSYDPIENAAETFTIVGVVANVRSGGCARSLSPRRISPMRRCRSNSCSWSFARRETR
jgi:hypothetical protein